jgi:hypothetical protein
MIKHLKYASYVARHKWYVFLACAERGLWWRGIKHDWHKMLPSEWLPYTNYFYGTPGESVVTKRDETGYYKPTDTGDKAFDFAWLLHQKRGDHHWQWWILPEDDGGTKILPMSPPARMEMICDWVGASMAQGHGGIEGVRVWYAANHGKMQLHSETREWVENFLGLALPHRDHYHHTAARAGDGVLRAVAARGPVELVCDECGETYMWPVSH